jgi:hypothetical protein
MKYLINSNFEFLRSNKTIFSRFEFLKFRYHWCTDVDFEKSDSIILVRLLRKGLAEYISFIVLRDALWSRAYIEHEDGKRARALDVAHLKKIVADALNSLSPTEKEVQYIVAELDRALNEERIDFSFLKSVPYEFRVLVARQLLNGFSLILVMDGLDCITIEDSKFDSERSQILDLIMKHRTTLTTFEFEVTDNFHPVTNYMSISIDSSSVFVMRENTFYLHENGLKNEVAMMKAQLFRVGAIDPQVAIYNVIMRISQVWAERSCATDEERIEIAKLLVRSTLLALRFINRAVGTGQPREFILGLFCGNLRALFQFLSRLLRWLIEDAIRDGLLRLTPSTTVRDIFSAMTGTPGLEVLRRKSYRIVEILLFSDVPWFENQVAIANQSSAAREFIGQRKTPFRDNEHFSGVVDNIFNYHSLKYVRSNDRHGLLEKIRIIQLLSNDSKTSDQLEEQLFLRIGYESARIIDSLTILTRSQLIVVSISGGELYFSATERGKILVQYLGRNLSYLEHVFHRTLFPKALIDKIEDDRRTKDVDHWTASSIRNAFIFLTYLKFVENNDANGKSVPGTLRIFEDTRGRVAQSIRKILYSSDGANRRFDPSPDRADARRESNSDHRQQIIRRALRMIENTLNDWEQAGCLASGKGRTGPSVTGRS